MSKGNIEKKFPDPGQESSTPCLGNIGFILPENPPPYSPPNYPIAYNAIIPPVLESPGIPSVAQEVPSIRLVLSKASKLERTIFLRKVYSVLVVKSIAMCGIISLFMYLPALNLEIEDMSGWKFWPFWAFGLVVASIVTTLDIFMRNSRTPPCNIILLSIITFVSAALLGTLSTRIQSEKILVDVGIVGIICFGVILFTFQHKFHYTPFNSFIYYFSCIIAAFGFLCIVYPPLESFIMIIAPWFFFTYVIAATQFMMKDKQLMILSTEYIYAAVSVCMFFVEIISKIIGACPCFKSST